MVRILGQLVHVYDVREGAFVANIGGRVEPVTKAEFQAKSKQLPPSLFRGAKGASVASGLAQAVERASAIAEAAKAAARAGCGSLLIAL